MAICLVASDGSEMEYPSMNTMIVKSSAMWDLPLVGPKWLFGGSKWPRVQLLSCALTCYIASVLTVVCGRQRLDWMACACARGWPTGSSYPPLCIYISLSLWPFLGAGSAAGGPHRAGAPTYDQERRILLQYSIG